MMKLIKKLFLIGLVLSILGGVFLAGIFTNDALRGPDNNYFITTVTGNSMLPLFPEEKEKIIVFTE